MAAIVLIVEDEPFLRFQAADIAHEAGYEVLEASNADEAIAILESRADVRIVFTDIQMPGSMDGVKLAHAIRNRWPPVAIIVTSGQVCPAGYMLPANVPFLGKPYDSEGLTQLLKLAA
ncbi:MAG TPA: response regulator [Rhizomicrobium sp.]|jgi:CheY-like chemotaxis protein